MRVFSGVQPTGNLHIGNYLGAIKQFVDLQEDNDCIYCVVDMHSITVPQDPKLLRGQILDIAALYRAAGLDPKKSILFVQSMVHEHAELSWILTCNSYTGEMSRMTQYKQKSKNQESAPTGLFCYPILMAADILIYDTDIVPVGIDQRQHIELTRDLANRMNYNFGEGTLVVPEGRYLKEGAKIMALDDPSAKMSKSAPNELSRICVLDDEKKIKKSIMKATTDSEGIIRFDPENKAGISNLLTIYSVFSGRPIDEIVKSYEGQGYGNFKKDLVEITIDALRPMKEIYNEMRYSQQLVDELKDGAERASAIAEKVLKRVQDRVGLGLE